MILWKKDSYSSKSESAQRNQELQLGHVSEVACGSHPGKVSHGRRHQRRLARIRRGMCASGKRVGNRHGASAKACTKNRGVCASGKRHRPTARSINQCLHASVVACAHLLGDIVRSLHTSTCRCRTWPGSIVSGLQNAVSRRRTWNAHNGQPRQNWAGTIVSGLHISISRCRTGLPQ